MPLADPSPTPGPVRQSALCEHHVLRAGASSVQAQPDPSALTLTASDDTGHGLPQDPVVTPQDPVVTLQAQPRCARHPCARGRILERWEMRSSGHVPPAIVTQKADCRPCPVASREVVRQHPVCCCGGCLLGTTCTNLSSLLKYLPIL